MFSKKIWNCLSIKMGLVSGVVMFQWFWGSGDCFLDNYFSVLLVFLVDIVVGIVIGIVVSNLFGV